MKIAVFGASGRTGRPVVTQALAAGHTVVAFVRDPAKLGITHERLEIVQGDVTDAAKVETAVVGADVVVSTLGHSPNSPKDILTVAMRHILAAMQKHGVRRIISASGAGVADQRDPAFWGAPLVRGPRRTAGPRTGTYRTGYLQLGLNNAVSRADVADFMLKLTQGDEGQPFRSQLLSPTAASLRALRIRRGCGRSAPCRPARNTPRGTSTRRVWRVQRGQS